ncbi:hypothetical protein [Peristeroidobacter soli]|jgi:hypothetical protein|uniref:hypothetical protein n=1 Tax=Peristeroidobacter soli TaxID=2497877 RepID=UPI00101D7906|nr:hypothetical protein [Peristeroidobacter soli]
MRIVVFSALVTLSACASVASQAGPAVLTESTPATHAELVKVVSTALNVATVTIADDALTKDSELVIERTPIRDAGGRRVQGRELSQPEHFQLIRANNRCFLVHARTKTEYELLSARCRQLP